MTKITSVVPEHRHRIELVFYFCQCRSVALLDADDPLRRRFDGFLKKLIILRDRRCRDPFCDAPIRHIDHIQRYTDGGLTIYPNGRGECERGNYAREMPGWTVEAVSSGLDGCQHTITITTPTGHTYLSRAP